MAALMDVSAPAPPTAGTGTTRQELKQVVASLVAAFATPVGRSAAELIAAADHSTEIARAFRHHLLLQTRERVLASLRVGIKRGEIRGGLDVEAAADLVMAPIFFRLLVGHHQLSDGFADRVVGMALDGIAP